MLTDGDYIMIKFWLHISNEVQLDRFIERQNDPYKIWKLTGEDWRNREKWSLYVRAANEMLEKTNKKHAPWKVIPGNDKKYARIQVLEETLEHVKSELKKRGLKLPDMITHSVAKEENENTQTMISE